MSKAHSPTVFNGEADNFYDPNFTLDINKRMRVPKSIRVSGDYTDEEIDTNGSGWNQVVGAEKFEMHVPDRILVVGKYIIFYHMLMYTFINCYITKLVSSLKIYFVKLLLVYKNKSDVICD